MPWDKGFEVFSIDVSHVPVIGVIFSGNRKWAILVIVVKCH